MPHDALLGYLEEVEDAIGDLQEAYVELYEEEFLTRDRVNLRIRIRFYNGCLLQLNESVVYQGKLEHLGYRYHFQGKNNELVFFATIILRIFRTYQIFRITNTKRQAWNHQSLHRF